MSTFIECPDCKGKGHVFDSLSIGFGGWGLFFGLFERNDREAISRKTCGHCNGTGYIKIEGKIKK